MFLFSKLLRLSSVSSLFLSHSLSYHHLMLFHPLNCEVPEAKKQVLSYLSIPSTSLLIPGAEE
jgi:hypothetical protein